jgi:hypothetical protein
VAGPQGVTAGSVPFRGAGVQFVRPVPNRRGFRRTGRAFHLASGLDWLIREHARSGSGMLRPLTQYLRKPTLSFSAMSVVTGQQPPFTPHKYRVGIYAGEFSRGKKPGELTR